MACSQLHPIDKSLQNEVGTSWCTRGAGRRECPVLLCLAYSVVLPGNEACVCRHMDSKGKSLNGAGKTSAVTLVKTSAVTLVKHVCPCGERRMRRGGWEHAVPWPLKEQP